MASIDNEFDGLVSAALDIVTLPSECVSLNRPGFED
jgi:hypothetical protein